MTQNPYQQGTPAGYGQPQHAYAQPGQTPPTQYASQGEPEVFGKAAPATGGETVKIHQMVDRLVLFRPISYNPLAQGYGSNPPGPQIICEAIIFDGPPVPGMVDGRNGQVTAPFNSGPKVPPFYVANVYITHDVLLKQLMDSVPSRAFVLGRIGKGQAKGSNDAPFKIIDPTPQDEAVARQHIGNRIADGFDRIKAASAPEPQQPFGGTGYQQQAPAPYQPQPVAQQYPQYNQQPAQPQPYAAPTPQQYPPQGPPGAPWAQQQQAPAQQQQAPQGDPWAGTPVDQQDQPAPAGPPWAQPQQASYPGPQQ